MQWLYLIANLALFGVCFVRALRMAVKHRRHPPRRFWGILPLSFCCVSLLVVLLPLAGAITTGSLEDASVAWPMFVPAIIFWAMAFALIQLVAALSSTETVQLLDREIAERKRVERSLEESEKKFMDVFRASDNAILLLDGETFVDCNQATVDMLRYDCRDDVLSTHPSELSPPKQPDGRDSFEKANDMIATAHRKSVHRFEWIHRKADGDDFPVEVTLTPVPLHGRQILHVVWKDLTGQKQTEAILRQTEQQYRAVVESVPGGIYRCKLGSVWDLEFLGDGIEEITGYPACGFRPGAELNYSNIVHRADREQVDHEINEAIEAHRDFALEYRIVDAGGHIHWFYEKGRATYDESGTPVYLNGAIFDVTEQKRAEQRFQKLLDAAPDAMILVDESGNIVFVNKQAERMFRYDRHELLGQPIEILVPESLRDAHVAHRVALEEPTSRPMGTGLELQGRRKDGAIFPAEISLSPLETDRGMVVCSAIRDITQRKWAEDQLQHYADELERSNLELQQFAYVASHDLQEPLRAVGGFCELLQRRYRGRIDRQADKWLQFIAGGAKRMQMLVADLLDYSRADARSRPFAPVNLANVVEQAMTNLQSSIEESHAEITRDELPGISGDASQLVQLMQNLIGNAIKFHGEKTPKVHVSAVRNGEEWQISVADNGIGIAPEYRHQVFEVFKRLHQSDQYPGTGIGLAVCRRVVQRHGGRIWVDADREAGSTFHFTIPIAGQRTDDRHGTRETNH